MTLKDKTVSGLTWSFLDSFAVYIFSFIVSIILARLLEPEDFGLIGLTAIFIAVSRVFIDAGFSDALIRKNNPTKDDYSSVLYFNIFVGIIFYIILYFSSSSISKFFNEPRLIILIRVVGLGLIINTTATIQRIILKKNLNFKFLAMVNVISTIVGGFISVYMAFSGYGVWSLALGGIISGILSAILFWSYNSWKPNKFFNHKTIMENFNFGSKIMIGSFINVLYNYMYYVMIGRIFTPVELGYYTKADNYQKLPSSNLDIIVRQVTYPLLATIQDDKNRLKKYYQTIIRTTSFIICIILFSMAAMAPSLIITLIGEKWQPSISYLQILCFAGIFVPLISINTNVLNIKGRSDLSLLITTMKIIISLPTLILGFYYGIHEMILGMIGALIIVYAVSIKFTSKLIDYTIRQQVIDVLSSIKIALIISIPIFFIGQIITAVEPLKLLFQILTGFAFFLISGNILKNKEYFLIIDTLKKRFKRFPRFLLRKN